MRKPYCSTSVAVEKSRADIRRLLLKYAAANVRLADEKRGLSLRFSLKIKDERHVLSFRVPIDSGVRNRQKRDRDEQGAWRALYWTVKSLVEAIHFKMEISGEVQKGSQRASSDPTLSLCQGKQEMVHEKRNTSANRRLIAHEMYY